MTKLLAFCAALVLAATAWAQAVMASGEVTRIDAAGGRITLKHGEIRNLDMPPMTMAFRVREARLIEGLAVGDKVEFAAERIDGSFTVTAIRKQP